MKKKILSINGEEPINYIQNFSGNFRNLKSPQGTFLKNIKSFNMIPISNYPFEKDKLTNIKIIYESKSTKILAIFYSPIIIKTLFIINTIIIFRI